MHAERLVNTPYFPYGGNYDKIAPVEWTNKDENMVKVYFYQWYDIEEHYKVANPVYMIEDEATQEAALMFLQMLAEDSDDDGFNPEEELLAFGSELKGEIEEYFGDLLDEVFGFAPPTAQPPGAPDPGPLNRVNPWYVFSPTSGRRPDHGKSRSGHFP